MEASDYPIPLRRPLRISPFRSRIPSFRRNPLLGGSLLFHNPRIESHNGSKAMQFTAVIVAHVAAALGAVVIGGITLFLRKGTAVHRLFGRLWVLLMLIAALVSFAIRSSGRLSWIHLLSVWILITLGMALYTIIVKRNINAHKRWMTNGYIGLVTAAVIALLPARLLGHLVWQTVGLI
jgi:uncharacterized membrane protein